MVDEDKRRFVKHLGMVGGAGLLGLAISYGSSPTQESLLDGLESVEQERGYRKVWATKRDEEENYGIPYVTYFDDAERLGVYRCDKCGTIYDVTAGREQRFDELPSDWVCTRPECGGASKSDFKPIGIEFRSGGQPRINEVVCAYHVFEPVEGSDKVKEHLEIFCSMPCRTICPVDAIEKKTFSETTGPDDLDKIGPVVDFDTCIGCGRCHKICGYNSIEWVNKPYTGKAGGGD